MKAGLKYDCDSCPLSTKRIKSGGEGRYPGSRHRVRGAMAGYSGGTAPVSHRLPCCPGTSGRPSNSWAGPFDCNVLCNVRSLVPVLYAGLDGWATGRQRAGKFLRGSQSPDLEITKDQKSRSGTVANTSRSANDAANARPTFPIPAAPLSAIMTWERTCYTNP